MHNINLSKRMGAIAAHVPLFGGVADVGTDHGYIPVWLLQNGFSGYVAATDINKMPLESAKQTAMEYGFFNKISFHLCDGLAQVNDDLISTVIIAGMGGEMIASILEKARWTHEKFLILQPMTKSERLRSWLFENDYRVLTESLVNDSATYEILTATGGTDSPYEAGELLTGHFSLISSNPLFPARLQGLIEKTEHAATGLLSSRVANSGAKHEAFLKTLSGLRSMQSRLS